MNLTNSTTTNLENIPNPVPLIDRISEFQVNSTPDIIPTATDRWLLASNLQKAIRRGLTDVAMGTANKLLIVDARYFWRRLLVIAYEDIGYGDITKCHDLLRML